MDLPRPVTATAAHVLQVAASCSLRGVRGAMATVVERHGSAPGTPGQKLYLAEDGTCVGTVGGGAIERETLRALLAIASDPLARHRMQAFKLGAELGMCCGGRLEVLVEPIEGVTPCLVVGGGHVASVVAPMLARLGFAVTVVDAREGWGDANRIEGVRCVTGDHDDIDDVDPRGVCLVMTHDHQLDQEAIAWALARGFAFVGGIGSRAKAERTRQRLEARGVAAHDVARVRMPLGLEIGARLPDEIAVAVAAELVAWKKRVRPRGGGRER
ncbi:MAG: Xanthine and dehydrogenase maturation factor, XdhC/CoxF family [Labilithrix sp.]|nr:Xanthine and dehydrogenase maturation factor, XdhC/CoxF family [Labilithrix sp.]